jgi:diaminohydroxyphosphoribosylaminopyrimidine deaminase/5-amino-6-(5-phosphoribosylamino)uracil reductase
MGVSSEDRQMMAEAIRLAALGQYSCAPNPRVGCVVARDGAIIASGHHRRAGGPHAEIEALAGRDVRDSTVYVTLEPCSHHGRTPPCADALIAAGVTRVVVAGADPNPLVAGAGLCRLREAGVTVELGVLEREARELNPGFFKRMKTGMPWVRCKLAMSLDGRTAMDSGASKWITGEAARLDVQRLRARSCAVLSGINTVLLDDPRLDVRVDPLDGLEVGRQPVRVIVDSGLRLPLHARLLGEPGEVIVATAARDPEREQALAAAGVTVLRLANGIGRIDLAALLEHLAAAQCNEVLIEAGATLAGAALQAGLIDELVIYMAPLLMGSSARPLFDLPIALMEQARVLEIREVCALGADWRITAVPDCGGMAVKEN